MGSKPISPPDGTGQYVSPIHYTIPWAAMCTVLPVPVPVQCVQAMTPAYTTSNLITKNLFVTSSTCCNRTFLTLKSIRSVSPLRKIIARNSQVLVVTEFVASGTQCNAIVKLQCYMYVVGARILCRIEFHGYKIS